MCGEKELFFALYSKEAPDACPLILYKKSLKNSKIRKLKKIKENQRKKEIISKNTVIYDDEKSCRK